VREILFYDGRCPICCREVRVLQRLAGEGLCFHDLHQTKDVSMPGREALLRNLHLKRANGCFVTGLEANVAMWQHTSFGWLWLWLMWRGVRPVAEWFYARWAERRYRRLYGCALTGEGCAD
jgi:predicted DCC family thiol-disulfide oxidoreductase YuxK